MPDDIVLVLDDFHFIQRAGLPRAGPVPDREPARPGAPGHRHPLRPRAASRPAARLQRPRRDPCRRPQLHHATRRPSCSPTMTCSVSPTTVSQLMERTEGWPAGLYLATLSLAGRADPDDFVRRFSGGNRFIGDYLTEEVLSRHTDRVRDFITTVSILDRFSASLCDHVAGHHRLGDDPARPGTLEPVRRPPRRGPPSGSASTTCSRPWRAASSSSCAPDHVRSLHARAAEWFRSHGHVDEAVQHSWPPGTPTTPPRWSRPTGCSTSTRAGRRPCVGWLEALGSGRRRHRARGARHGRLDGCARRRRGGPGRPPRRPGRASVTTARCPTDRARSSPPSP